MQTPKNLIFDVDGTLTPARQSISKDLLKLLADLVSEGYKIYLATGSDYPKTVEQLTRDFVENYVTYSFNCSGNSIWQKGKEIYRDEWSIPEVPMRWLHSVLKASNCPIKTGFHFDSRPGMLNFSIVGRNATFEQREEYAQYDKTHNERHSLAAEFNALFSDKYHITAQVAGATGFDIYPIGKDKSQILSYFEDVPVVFFGDDTAPGGNDYTLATAILDRQLIKDEVCPVTSPKDTASILRRLP